MKVLRPDRAYVERVARALCRRHGVQFHDVIGPHGSQRDCWVRARIWATILRRTGCSQNGLAEVWGCDVGSILRYRLRGDGPLEPAHLTAEKIQARNTLAFVYGADRAAAILAGEAPATKADVAAWACLGRRAAA